MNMTCTKRNDVLQADAEHVILRPKTLLVCIHAFIYSEQNTL